MNATDFVKKWFDTIDRKDVQALQGLLADNHVLHFAMSPVPLDKQGHLQMSQGFFSAFSNLKHTAQVTFTDGSWVAWRGTFSGKHTGEFNGIPATNKEVSFSFIDLMRVENGKNAEEWMEMDGVGLLTQLGIIPAAQAQPA